MRSRWIITVLAVVLFWAAGFYPFQWSPPSHFGITEDGRAIRYSKTYLVANEAVYRDSAGAVAFRAPSIAVMPHRPAWLSEVAESSVFSVELSVRSSLSSQEGPARIFTISQDLWERNLTIGQEGSDLIIRLRTPDTDRSGVPPYEVPRVFRALDTVHIALDVRSTQMRVRIDGAEMLSALLPERPLAVWSPDYRLALGNELTFDRPWLGEVYRAQVRWTSDSLDLLEPGRLQSPSPFEVEHVRRVSLVPFIDALAADQNPYGDWIANFVGFFALGILIVAVGGWSVTVAAVTLLCVGVSLSIEVGQLFLGERMPAVEDLILNTAGGFLGALVARRAGESKSSDASRNGGRTAERLVGRE